MLVKRMNSLNHYDQNPLINPLAKFHGRVIKTANTLEKKGKMIEVAKRIAIILIAPLAYLALGLTALIGLSLHSRLVKPQAKEAPINQKEVTQVDLMTQLKQEKPTILQRINSAISFDSIEKALFMINIEGKEALHYQKDYFFKETPINADIKEHFKAEIDLIFEEINKEFPYQSNEHVKFSWHVLIQGKNGDFGGAHGWKSRNDLVDKSGSGHELLDLKDVRTGFEMILESMGREAKIEELLSLFNLNKGSNTLREAKAIFA